MRVGVDVGGTHICVGVVDGNNIVEKVETETKNVNVLEFVVSSVQNFINKYANIEKIGVGYCGTVREGLIEKSPNLKLENCNLRNILEEKLHVLVILRNDAKCAGLAEMKYGAMQGYNDAVLLTLGTGIGGAYFYNGKLVEPKRSSGFEFGHMQIQKNGITCKCGKSGCFEKYASISALKRDVTIALNITKELSGIELKETIEKNREVLKNVLNEYINNLSIGISNIISILEPEIIVLGGSFVYYEDIFLEAVINKVKEISNMNNLPKIITAMSKNDAGVIGAVLDNA